MIDRLVIHIPFLDTYVVNGNGEDTGIMDVLTSLTLRPQLQVVPSIAPVMEESPWKTSITLTSPFHRGPLAWLLSHSLAQ